jgi:hypothetical protein
LFLKNPDSISILKFFGENYFKIKIQSVFKILYRKACILFQQSSTDLSLNGSIAQRIYRSTDLSLNGSIAQRISTKFNGSIRPRENHKIEIHLIPILPYNMAIVISSDEFREFNQYWDISDNLSTDDLKKLRQKIPEGRQIVAICILRDTHPLWENYTNTEVTYLRWEHASGAELRTTWSIQHPVGDIYVVYD